MATSSLQKLHIQGETNSEAETSVKEFIAYCEHLERQEKSSQVNQNFSQGANTLRGCLKSFEGLNFTKKEGAESRGK